MIRGTFFFAGALRTSSILLQLSKVKVPTAPPRQTKMPTILSSVITDARGEFKISDIDYGSYDLRIELSGGRITIPRLPVTQD